MKLSQSEWEARIRAPYSRAAADEAIALAILHRQQTGWDRSDLKNAISDAQLRLTIQDIRGLERK